ncbi:putative nuclease HARBI1 [Anoplophora glabripennis]|uniref:putative nuclease HARBI1 n=1 Tax=Anoplophora glabripennis TaxID=217634 RepID=UPI000875A51C|nr:putative nuclease HARBI1 [Anoplophora glabripennis]
MGKLILEVNRIFKIITWPTRPRALKIITAFENINRFPGVLGCIDGSHIKILPPKENPNSYVNRKKFHSVLLQGVCDNEKLFLEVFTGLPGSCHDARLFHMSDLYERINNNSIEFVNNSHIIGDLAYTLTTNLIVGFKDYGNLTNQQRRFNMKLSQLRVRIEQAFAFLKGRFRRLKYMETVKFDLICLFIIDPT